ncbi:MAG: large conductance mechanosensitive channel protein MscL [Gammaproteobacteria bacterium]|nr:large conductance mechanosensitive channel protein MscL [Gammaproteobacteria bacterium]
MTDFRAFIMRGNVVDMAIGIVIGAAFGTVVKSFVSDVLMPPIGYLIGGVNFSNLFLVISPGTTPGPYETIALAQKAGAATLNYGAFINTVISLIIVAFAVFMLMRGIMKMRARFEKPQEPAAPTTKACPRCCSAIPLPATRCPNCTSELEAG